MKIIKRAFLIAVVLTGFCFASNAQSNALEAKAAYLLAEEHYGKGEMRIALQYLDDAIAKMGSVNAKILYLKVNVLKELGGKDTSVLQQLDAAIADFEKAPDYADFNEEKSLEVMKIKLERNRSKFAAANIAQRIAAFEEQGKWFVGVSVDSLYGLHRQQFDDYYKTYTLKKTKPDADGYIFFTENNKATEGIYYTGRIVHTYSKFLFIYSDETPGFPKSNAAFPALLKQYRDFFGTAPTESTKTVQNTVSGQVYTAVNQQYSWKSNDKVFILYMVQTTGPQFYSSQAGITLTNDAKTLSAM